MARIALIVPDQAPQEVKEIYEQKLKGSKATRRKRSPTGGGYLITAVESPLPGDRR